MSEEKYKAEQLWGELVSEHTISCTKCRKTDNIMQCDEYDACESFFEDGWRKTNAHCYCPKCAKKYLKQ